MLWKAGGEGNDRGWDDWMVLLTQWIWIWENSRRWWRTGKPGVLQSNGSQGVRHDLATEQQQCASLDIFWELVLTSLPGSPAAPARPGRPWGPGGPRSPFWPLGPGLPFSPCVQKNKFVFLSRKSINMILLDVFISQGWTLYYSILMEFVPKTPCQRKNALGNKLLVCSNLFNEPGCLSNYIDYHIRIHPNMRCISRHGYCKKKNND